MILNSRILLLWFAYWISTGPVLNHFIKNMAFSKSILAAKNARSKCQHMQQSSMNKTTLLGKN